MNLKLLTAAILACSSLWTTGRTAADLFVEAPAWAVPMLEKNRRLDMIDYFNSNLPTPSSNTLNGKSRITALADNAVAIQLGRDSSLQLALLTNKTDTVVAVVETVLTPVADSSIHIYRLSDWAELPAPALPGVAEFLDPARRKDSAGVDMPDYMFVRAEFDSDSGVFKFTNTTPAYYTEQDRPEGLGLLRSNIAMRLKGNKFIEVK